MRALSYSTHFSNPMLLRRKRSMFAIDRHQRWIGGYNLRTYGASDQAAATIGAASTTNTNARHVAEPSYAITQPLF